MKKLKYIILSFLIIAPCCVNAQKGNVVVNADSRIADLVDMHILFNQKAQTISGYRIMIAALSGNNSKAAAFRIKNSFLSSYEASAYLTFEEPNFKVKVGDFKTRLEAFAFLQKIKASYPNAFIIKDKIYPLKLNNSSSSEDEDIE